MSVPHTMSYVYVGFPYRNSPSLNFNNTEYIDLFKCKLNSPHNLWLKNSTSRCLQYISTGHPKGCLGILGWFGCLYDRRCYRHLACGRAKDTKCLAMCHEWTGRTAHSECQWLHHRETPPERNSSPSVPTDMYKNVHCNIAINVVITI